MRFTFAVVASLALYALPAPAASTAAASGRYVCPGYAPTRAAIGGREVRGLIARGQLWALLFYQPPAPPRIGIKIVIHMTGSGTLHIQAEGRGGGIIHPVWGPEPHDGSNWLRPGDEWGTGWRIPAPGCWRLHAWRQHASGDIWLQVRARTGTRAEIEKDSLPGHAADSGITGSAILDR